MYEAPKGYYIEGWSQGGSCGPRIRELEEGRNEGNKYGGSSTNIFLVYGKPVFGRFEAPLVHPIESAYELLRYDDPAEQKDIFVTRYDPTNIIWGADESWDAVPTTPELSRLFDNLLPNWQIQHELYLRRNRRAYFNAIGRAGLTRLDIPRYPKGENVSEGDIENAERAFGVFYEKISPHIRPPKPLLVRVEGIDNILDQISVAPLPDRNLR